MAEFEAVGRVRLSIAGILTFSIYRDKTLLIAHIGLACILGVFAGGLYFHVDITISGFQNRVGSLFFLGVLLAFSSLR